LHCKTLRESVPGGAYSCTRLIGKADYMPVSEAILHTCSGAHAIHLRLATSFIARFAGLMLTKPLAARQGMLLTGCPSVHTAFMRYAIDVIYLDEGGQVLKCVPDLKPWRASFSRFGKRSHAAAHTLELATGSIARFDIRSGDRLQHPLLDRRSEADSKSKPDTGKTLSAQSRQRGATMVEFVVVGPVLTMLGLSLLQYGMLFFAKNQINHATFMAARAGAMGNARVATIEDAYLKALIPLYGGGTDETQLRESLQKARLDLLGNGQLHIAMLNPTRESFDDWNDPALQRTLGNGRRVIPNDNLPLKDPHDIGSRSGQNIHDANLIKLRVTHGYAPKVPLMGTIYNRYLRWMDNGTDADYTGMVNAGRIPMVSHVTLHMHSDAIEPEHPISSPGPGNNGNPGTSGTPPVTTNPPAIPSDPGSGGNPPTIPDGGGENCTGGWCPICLPDEREGQAG
jgi:uncharacterized membrane protein (UPF0127 family)